MVERKNLPHFCGESQNTFIQRVCTKLSPNMFIHWLVFTPAQAFQIVNHAIHILSSSRFQIVNHTIHMMSSLQGPLRYIPINGERIDGNVSLWIRVRQKKKANQNFLALDLNALEFNGIFKFFFSLDIRFNKIRPYDKSWGPPWWSWESYPWSLRFDMSPDSPSHLSSHEQVEQSHPHPRNIPWLAHSRRVKCAKGFGLIQRDV